MKYIKKPITVILLVFFTLLINTLYANEDKKSALGVNSKELKEEIISKDDKFANVEVKYSCIKPLFIKDIDKKQINKNQQELGSIEIWGVKGNCTWVVSYDIEELKKSQSRKLQGKEDVSYVPIIEYSSSIRVKFKLNTQNNKVNLKEEIPYFIVFVDKQTQDILDRKNYTIKVNKKVKQNKDTFIEGDKINLNYSLPVNKALDLEILIGFENL